MRKIGALLVLSLVAAACGDNRPGGPMHLSPAGTSMVGGSQVAHSKSFMLVTSVSSVNQPVASSSKNTLNSGLGEQ